MEHGAAAERGRQKWARCQTANWINQKAHLEAQVEIRNRPRLLDQFEYGDCGPAEVVDTVRGGNRARPALARFAVDEDAPAAVEGGVEERTRLGKKIADLRITRVLDGNPHVCDLQIAIWALNLFERRHIEHVRDAHL